MNSIFWHDYETFGADPRRDRACQFAGIRTDLELNEIDAPVEFFCKPAPDFLPAPGAIAVTGISPLELLKKGMNEAEFCGRIVREFMEPGTCVAGYNSIRFDDELTRHMLYRCFHDPYEREWKNGNSRWDIIDLVRMTHALRPEGIVWPTREDGTPSFRLEDLTRANGIEHLGAHDAVADVRATIAVAKLMRAKQPKLYDFLFELRSKARVLQLLDLAQQRPVLHVSRMFPASRGCLAVVLPLCKHPQNPNGILVVDLLGDPSAWLGLDAEALAQRLFTPREELGEGVVRVPIKTVHLNRCPALAPLGVLTDDAKARYAIDIEAVKRHRELILADRTLAVKLHEVFTREAGRAETDPDFMLYSGGFFGDADRRLMESIRGLQAAQLAATVFRFQDPRLPEMLFRYRARNFPETLSPEERQRWRDYCRRRLTGEAQGAGLTRAEFEKELQEAGERLSPGLRADLRRYADEIYRQWELPD